MSAKIGDPGNVVSLAGVLLHRELLKRIHLNRHAGYGFTSHAVNFAKIQSWKR